MHTGKAIEETPVRQDAAVDHAAYKTAMRRVLGGVVIVTTGNLAEPVGMTATSVVSLSVEPPSLIACVNKTASAHDVMLRCGLFAVNALCAHHVDLAEVFSGRDGLKGSARFRFGHWRALSTGAPVLGDSSVSFDCVLREVFDGGTHSILVGNVVAMSQAADGMPLAYWSGGYGTLAARQA